MSIVSEEVVADDVLKRGSSRGVSLRRPREQVQVRRCRSTAQTHRVTPLTCGSARARRVARRLSRRVTGRKLLITRMLVLRRRRARCVERRVLRVHHDHGDQQKARRGELRADEQRRREPRADPHAADAQRFDRPHAATARTQDRRRRAAVTAASRPATNSQNARREDSRAACRRRPRCARSGASSPTATTAIERRDA